MYNSQEDTGKIGASEKKTGKMFQGKPLLKHNYTVVLRNFHPGPPFKFNLSRTSYQTNWDVTSL